MGLDTRLGRALIGVIGFGATAFLIIGLMLASIEWVAFDMGHYEKQYKKLGVPESTGMDEEELLRVTEGLLDYIRDKRKDLKITATITGQKQQVFNQKEIDHMVDVKELFLLGYKLKGISFAIFIIVGVIVIIVFGKRGLRSLCKSYLWALGAFAVLSLFIVIYALVDFSSAWTQFHHIFFTNDLWILDPRTDILILMVPEKFFFSTIMRILTLYGLSAIFFAVASVGVVLKSRTRDLCK